MSAPLISIISINLNNAAGLERSIQSVLSQSFKNFELIVIDGASTDNSAAIITKYKSQFSFSCSEKDSGIYDAMNKGIQQAKGEYLLFLNSGDYLLDEAVLAAVAPQLKEHDVISGDIKIEDKQGNTRICQSHNDITLDFFLDISLYHQATFVARNLFLENGLYDTSYRYAGDYEFFIRAFFKHNASYKHLPLCISYFKEDGFSNDPKLLPLIKAESERAWLQNVSPRGLALLKEGQKFKNSSVYWLYHKTLKGGVYSAVLNFIYQIRVRIYRALKK